MKRSTRKQHSRRALVLTALLLLAPALAAASPLTDAVKRNEKAEVERLLGVGEAINALDETQDAALHLAVFQASPDIVLLLLEKGADIELPNGGGNTPLHVAVGRGRQAMVKLLLDKGAKPDPRNVHQATPLHVCAESMRDNLAILLLDRKAEVNARNMHGATPLHIAAESGSVDLVRVLLDRGADRNAKNTAGGIPADLAQPGSPVLPLLRVPSSPTAGN